MKNCSYLKIPLMKGYIFMEEKLYTIPLTEAFEADDECPLCFVGPEDFKEITEEEA